jgi:hypothetical protein
VKRLAAAIIVCFCANAYAQEADGGVEDKPFAIQIDEGVVVPHGSTDVLKVPEGMYLNAAATIQIVTEVKKAQAERDAIAVAYESAEKQLQAKTTSPIIAAIVVGVICLGGGVALGIALK